MKLLSLQVALQPMAGQSALAEAPFLGGVLHGVFEHLIRSHSPQLTGLLGMTEGVRYKQYAVLPPPYGWQADLRHATVYLGCGVMLFGEAANHDQVVSDALRCWEELRYGDRRDRVDHLDIQVHDPGIAPESSALDSLTLEWNTPLTLDSQGKWAAGATHVAPNLLAVVRSLVKRIRAVEPALAEELDLNGQDWIVAEESIRRLLVAKHTLRSAPWVYGSRKHNRPFELEGLLGQVSYSGPIPAAIHALLKWGVWFGAGQGTALGRGMYQLKEK
ncbi:MAG: CRISPR system precrRNA processing endoribonuclease RAMP protein Cas6 [Candidatus Accumulibacter meliphilus]|jgi:hypothetical protein|uniref:CRISPR system precrRNA processing endoribonuclease RAMP protein Cas6 n=1 Tax=Candidatus Accumulibacter meliphilus TaxID=2211374 RepID=UPI002FC37EC3